MEDTLITVINNYIEFYKNEIQNVDIFVGMDISDLGSTNIQIETLYSEMNKYASSDEKSKDVLLVSQNVELKKFVICKNNDPFCTSDLLFAVLLEIINLREADDISIYNIKLRKNIK